jgi:hypothetical protein
MVCQQLDQLEWVFIQARTESQDIDSLDGQIVSFHALGGYWIISWRGIKANAAWGLNTIQGYQDS